MADRVTLYGAPYSVYARIVRLILEEAQIPYHWNEVDIFAEGGPPAGYDKIHPFGKIPALAHGDFSVFETDAIVTYLAAAFSLHELVPKAPQDQARMVQLQRIVDNYAYRDLVWGIYVAEREESIGQALDPEARNHAERSLKVLEGFCAGPYFLGTEVTLADFWCLPVLTYLALAPSGEELFNGAPKLRSWLGEMQNRSAVAATPFPAEAESP